MKKERIEMIEGLLKQAPRRGRPKGGGLNIITLDPNAKRRGHLLPIGDIHLGAPTCDRQLVEQLIAYALSRHIHVIGMGDWLEAATRYSVGQGVYEQVMNVQEQVDTIIEMFKPLALAGLLSGAHTGNHENRISKAVGIDIMRIICRILNIKYFRYGQHHLVRCGKQSYTAYSHHGASGARLPYTKIKAALDTARFISAELVMMGHVHSLDTLTQEFFGIDKRCKTICKREKTFILTGHFLKYTDSYAEMKNMVPSRLGAAKIEFGADTHKIHVSI